MDNLPHRRIIGKPRKVKTRAFPSLHCKDWVNTTFNPSRLLFLFTQAAEYLVQQVGYEHRTCGHITRLLRRPFVAPALFTFPPHAIS